MHIKPNDEFTELEQYFQENVNEKSTSHRSWYHSVFNEVKNFLPWLHWVPDYRHHKKDILGDISAGITVALMLIPQSMSYSMLSGLSPVYGLYSCFVPLLMYSIFASAKQLAVGPVAILALMTANAVQSLGPRNFKDYVMYAHLIAVCSGLIQILVGVFRLGFLMNFMSHTVIAGFTSSAALIIAGSQVKLILGIKIADEKQFHLLLKNIILNIKFTHMPTFLLGLSCLGILFFMKYFQIHIRGTKYTLNRIPSALTVVLLGTVAMFLLAKFGGHFDSKSLKVNGIKILGDIPEGIPKPILPFFLTANGDSIFTWDRITTILISSAAIALIGLLESVSICKFLASRYKYQFDTNQELLALGMACLTSGFFQGIPITGGLSRTAVNAQAGARTPLAGIFTALLIMVVLLFLTKLLYFLPTVVLAAIIIIACLQFIDIHSFIYTFKTKKRDALSYAAAFIGTLFLGVEKGILVATGVSLFILLFRSSRPRYSIMGRLPGTTHYRDIAYWPDAVSIPGILIVRFDSDLSFVSAAFIQETILELIEKDKYQVHAVILDCSSINEVDSTAPHMLNHVIEVLSPKKLYFAQMKPDVLRVLKRGGMFREIELEHLVQATMDNVPLLAGTEEYTSNQFFLFTEQAVQHAMQSVKNQLQEEYDAVTSIQVG